MRAALLTSTNVSFAQMYDYEYDSNTESVLHDRAWGFCHPKCFARKEDILALDLQEVCLKDDLEFKVLFEVELWILSDKECRNRTWAHSKTKFRARIDRFKQASY